MPFYKLVTHPIFNFVIFLLIIGNSVVLTADSYPQARKEKKQLEEINSYFTCVFVAEMVLKLVGLGPKSYVRDSYNKFDAFVVACSVIEEVLKRTLAQERLENMSFFVAFKCLRLMRIFKLARTWEALQSTL